MCVLVSCLYTHFQFLTAAWEKDLDQFYSFKFLDDVRRRSNANRALSVTNALSYFPYYGMMMLDESDEEIQVSGYAAV